MVNVSSSAGHLSRIPGENLRNKFADSNLTLKQLDQLMKEYIENVKNDTFEAKGWPLRSHLTKARLSSTYR